MEPSTLPLRPESPAPADTLPANRRGYLRRGPAERVLGRCGGHGPTLLVIAGVHGNEPAGILGLDRVFARLCPEDPAEGEAIRRQMSGRMVGLAGNLAALAEGRRYLHEDLNRLWLPDRLARVRSDVAVLATEDRELRDLDRELTNVLESATGPVYTLDLHTISGPGPAFTVLDDTLRNRTFALELGVPIVLGIEEEVSGTLMHHLSDQGVTAVGFESGQHESPDAVERAEAAIWLAMAAAGVLPVDFPEVSAARDRLARDSARLPEVVEVRDRHHIEPGDRFKMLPGFAGFRRVKKGQTLGSDIHGPVRAPEDGRLLMPLYQEQGNDGFFLVRSVAPLFLRMSASVRRLRLERFLHWLPGVRRHPELEGAYRVDRRWARFGALELFHLLGFARRGPRGRVVTFARRTFDDAHKPEPRRVDA